MRTKLAAATAAMTSTPGLDAPTDQLRDHMAHERLVELLDHDAARLHTVVQLSRAELQLKRVSPSP